MHDVASSIDAGEVSNGATRLFWVNQVLNPLLLLGLSGLGIWAWSVRDYGLETRAQVAELREWRAERIGNQYTVQDARDDQRLLTEQLKALENRLLTQYPPQWLTRTVEANVRKIDLVDEKLDAIRDDVTRVLTKLEQE